MRCLASAGEACSQEVWVRELQGAGQDSPRASQAPGTPQAAREVVGGQELTPSLALPAVRLTHLCKQAAESTRYLEGEGSPSSHGLQVCGGEGQPCTRQG